MNKRKIYAVRIRWGPLPYLLFFVIIFFISNILVVLKAGILFFLPIVFLLFVLRDILKSIYNILTGRYRMILYTTGIHINGVFLGWKKIKSISFHTGRYADTDFFLWMRLPALQKIFVLDKDGVEYSTPIDIDYWFKPDRRQNNLRKLREYLLGMDKMDIISDWAQKR